MNAIFTAPIAQNEPLHDYSAGTKARASLQAELARQSSTVVEVPIIIGGKEIRTGQIKEVVMPH